MKYMMMLRYAPGTGPQEGTPEFDDEMKRWMELNEELQGKGDVVIHAAGLETDEAATTVRAPGGEVVLTDGPYAETKELLFSFYIVDVPDLDAAVALAKRMPSVEYGSVEIRPLSAIEQTA